MFFCADSVCTGRLFVAVSSAVVNDTLDDMLDESGDEEEQDAIVTQVLDEIGIEISGKVGSLCDATADNWSIDLSVVIVLHFG